MEMLIMGLVLFLGLHSVRMGAPQWRAQMQSLLGEKGYKALFSAASAIGLGLIVWGFALARREPTPLWAPPLALRHGASLLTLAAFVLVTAAYIPANHFKAWLGHPMLAGTVLWALAHLLANGKNIDVLLFGGFFAWALLDFNACRRRDRAQGRTPPAGTARGTALACVVGALLWALFAGVLHAWLVGVRPLA